MVFIKAKHLVVTIRKHNIQNSKDEQNSLLLEQISIKERELESHEISHHNTRRLWGKCLQNYIKTNVQSRMLHLAK